MSGYPIFMIDRYVTTIQVIKIFNNFLWSIILKINLDNLNLLINQNIKKNMKKNLIKSIKLNM